MELRSVEELMDLLHACRGTRPTADGSGGPVDVHDHALQTAALLRRSHPADKELQVAGLVHGIGRIAAPRRRHRARPAGAGIGGAAARRPRLPSGTPPLRR